MLPEPHTIYFEGKDGDRVTPCACTVRKMHSFDRRIKSAHKHQNPDLEEDVPSYMRQTCASLVKRYSFKARDADSSDPKGSKAKDKKKGTKTQRKKSPGSEEGSARRRRSRSMSSLESRTESSSFSPRSELSSVTEATEEDLSSRSPRGHLSNKSTIPENDVLHEDAVATMVEECYKDAIHEVLTSGRTSPITPENNTKLGIRGPSMSSTLTLEDAFSEMAQDDSFCMMYETETEDGSAKPDMDAAAATYMGSFFRSTSESTVQPSTPHTSHSEKLYSKESADDLFGILDDEKWPEEGTEDGGDDVSKLESHRLNDVLLSSFTDSEFGGDELMQRMTEKHDDSMTYPLPTDRSEFNARSYKSSSEFDVRIPIHEDLFDVGPEGADIENRHLCKTDSKKLAGADGSFRIQAPGLFWMLGGNVLAGVLGAAIAATGMPLSPESKATETTEELLTPRSDGAHADDWFFQAAACQTYEE